MCNVYCVLYYALSKDESPEEQERMKQYPNSPVEITILNYSQLIMKYFKPFLLILTILIMNSTLVLAQKVKGDGNVVEENRSVSSFTEIQLDGVIDVYLSQGSSEQLKIVADKNLQQYIETSVKDGILYIKNTDDVEIRKKTKMDVYITVTNLTKLNMNGVGDVEALDNLQLKDIAIENSGVGNLKLKLSCNNLEMDMNGVGNVTFIGSVMNARIDNNGVGNLKAFDLSTDILRIQNNGVGNSEVNSDKEIYINLNGMGNVSYKGNAVVKELNKNGFGNIKKM